MFDFKLPRRSFLEVLASLGAAAGVSATPVARAVAAALDDLETYEWTACVINCGQRCPLRAFVKNGRVIRIETDNTAKDSCSHWQIRACLRGRSMRQRIYNPDRLKYPMKRIGERGEGKFKRITWDEAYREIAQRWKDIVAKYGNEAVHWIYCSGQQSLVSSRRAWWRLMNLMGGYLKYYGSYSTAQIAAAMPYTYGKRVFSDISEVANAKLYVSFGGNTSVTRASGGGRTYQLQCALEKHPTRMIMIDPVFTDTCVDKATEWIPIRLGTDAALCEALAHKFIVNNWVDQEFLDKYCIGYDEKTLPASAPANGDYKSYILGRGPDKREKTPEWAAPITGIPAKRIRELAREMGTTKPCFVAQGWGSQRQANGEQNARAIAMLPILLGQIGLPGTNPGDAESNTHMPAVYLPVGKNKVKATIPVFMWTDAIVRGHTMTDKNAGLRGVKALTQDIKMIVNSGGNTLINQHGDSNGTDRILRDTSKCEFILVCDNQMTPTCRYADILLPDTLGPETDDIATDGGSNGATCSILPMHKSVEPQWEQKSSWEICRDIARELGLEDKFTEGRDQLGWIEWCYNETRKKTKNKISDWETFWKGGPDHKGAPAQIYNACKKPVGLADFRKDPEKKKLNTPSGKIEIYSERLAKMAKEWELPKGDVISALPMYVQTWESHFDKLAKKYPLQCFGIHHHGRIHSTFHNLPWLREQHPDMVYMNTIDAKARRIKNGDMVRVYNKRGIVELPAYVTNRITPGVTMIPQGAWYKPVMRGGKRVDVGGNINTLSSMRPSPLAKGNAQHTILVQIRKIKARKEKAA